MTKTFPNVFHSFYLDDFDLVAEERKDNVQVNYLFSVTANHVLINVLLHLSSFKKCFLFP